MLISKNSQIAYFGLHEKHCVPSMGLEFTFISRCTKYRVKDSSILSQLRILELQDEIAGPYSELHGVYYLVTNNLQRIL